MPEKVNIMQLFTAYRKSCGTKDRFTKSPGHVHVLDRLYFIHMSHKSRAKRGIYSPGLDNECRVKKYPA